ncbi:hypothetical protein O181_093104 [Austropuccinia psidii MF-1]|uniref:Uncharacterized protein n=1 Tax=Austropuccinia psidii MF-1 TaxID=1389203 RepID=A0A9Q3J0T4_9BASI|nr:hypothetical protein [Austropuccinia psidii MF-1]
MPSTRSGASYNPSRSSQKGHRCDYGRSQSVTEGQGTDTATRILSGHIQSKPEGLQQCISAQGVPDPCRSVEKLQEFLPDCEKTPGPPQHLQAINGWHPLMEKKKMMLLTEEWRKNNPPPPKQVPKKNPVARSSNSNVKKQPQPQNKGNGKAPATKPYSQGYRIPKIKQDAMENVFQMARTMITFKKVPKLKEWPHFSGEGEYDHMEFIRGIEMIKENFELPDKLVTERFHTLFSRSSHRWYIKLRQAHGHQSWTWWKPQIINKWANDSWRLKVETAFESAKFNADKYKALPFCFQ